MEKRYRFHFVAECLNRVVESSRVLQFTVVLLMLLLMVMIVQNRKVLRKDFSINPTFQEIMISREIKPVTLKTLDGADFAWNNLHTNYVVLIFFDIDCFYCVRDIPLWQKMYEQSMTHNITILGITTETNVENITEYVLEHDIKFPVLLDQRQGLFNQLKISGTPTKVLCSSEQRILQVWQGWTTQQSHQSDLGGIYTFFGIKPDELPSNLP